MISRFRFWIISKLAGHNAVLINVCISNQAVAGLMVPNGARLYAENVTIDGVGVSAINDRR